MADNNFGQILDINEIEFYIKTSPVTYASTPNKKLLLYLDGTIEVQKANGQTFFETDNLKDALRAYNKL